jgi:peptidyl-prolyl cis-trans isomerase C
MEAISMRGETRFLALFVAGFWASSLCAAQPKKVAPRPSEGEALVVVNGQNITDADLLQFMQTRQVPVEDRDKYRRPFLEEMVDFRLMRSYLASKKISAKKEEVDRQIQQFQDEAAKGGRDPEKALIAIGYTAESLRDEFSLRLAWKRYIEGRLTPVQVQKHFATHRAEFDGTRVRARQIILKVPSKSEADFEKTEQELAELRQQILDGEISFEEAARTKSQGPSKEQGGDVGLFPFTGKMPQKFSREAFQLEVGEISPPFRSTFGVHLCQVTDRKPGELSLEDVRDEVLARMSQDLWKQTVADLRNGAKIEWKVKL